MPPYKVLDTSQHVVNLHPLYDPAFNLLGNHSSVSSVLHPDWESTIMAGFGLLCALRRTVHMFPLLLLASHHCYGQANTAVYNTVINNVPYPVTSDLGGAATLVYNCAKMPAICANAARTYPTNPADGSLVNGPVVMHYDTTSNSNRRRRRQSGCNGAKWRRGHPCPDTRNPIVVPSGSYIDPPGNPRPKVAAFYAQRWQPNVQGLNLFGAAEFAIADSNNDFQGLVWTCDEFPPAM